MKLILALILIALISSTTDTIKDKIFDKEKSNEPNLEFPPVLIPLAGIAIEAIAHASNVMTYNDIANTLYKAHKRHLKRLEDKKKGKNLRKKK